MNEKFKGIDTKELELPDTVFIRDIDNKVFQSIVIQCIEQLEGLYLIEGNLIDNFLGRDSFEKGKGIHIEQDQKNHAVKVKIEVSVSYGVSLPDIAEKIQTKIVQEICKLTGIRVSFVHVIFKNLITSEECEGQPSNSKESMRQEYSDDF